LELQKHKDDKMKKTKKLVQQLKSGVAIDWCSMAHGAH